MQHDNLREVKIKHIDFINDDFYNKSNTGIPLGIFPILRCLIELCKLLYSVSKNQSQRYLWSYGKNIDDLLWHNPNSHKQRISSREKKIKVKHMN